MVSGTLVVCITVSLFVYARPAARAETVVKAGSNTDSCKEKQIIFTTFKAVYNKKTWQQNIRPAHIYISNPFIPYNSYVSIYLCMVK